MTMRRYNRLREQTGTVVVFMSRCFITSRTIIVEHNTKRSNESFRKPVTTREIFRNPKLIATWVH